LAVHCRLSFAFQLDAADERLSVGVEVGEDLSHVWLVVLQLLQVVGRGSPSEVALKLLRLAVGM